MPGTCGTHETRSKILNYDFTYYSEPLEGSGVWGSTIFDTRSERLKFWKVVLIGNVHV